ncbi:hypothetical protein [Brevundimonas halotolerans]|uniref:Uncharacterized protein n=1 Tax=Brevundimonas halotolerans TaxID=69670 RepID=A0A7W9A4D7_9CAUL|nr:hypothetical protein [Brevundimonas halotolerans]MBB5661098.1 hypothetical protein [Brevundimonas halotolerans]
MSLLKSLKLSAAKPQNQPASPQDRNREKLRGYLAEQRALIEATVAGKPYAGVRTVTKTDDTGNRTRVEVPRTVRKGWFTGDGGKVYFQLRYGGKPLELAKGMTAVEADNLAAIGPVIDTLDQAVLAGEFDAAVAAAAQARAAMMKTAKAKKAG